MSAKRIALIGAGSMGRNHARVIAENPSAVLATIVDPFAETGEAVASQYGARWVPELELGDIDAVVVAASTEHHFRIAKEIIDAGLPLLVEKPICPSFAQTQEILGAAEKSGTPIMCGFLERYNPAIIVAKKMIDEPLYARADRHSSYAPRIIA